MGLRRRSGRGPGHRVHQPTQGRARVLPLVVRRVRRLQPLASDGTEQSELFAHWRHHAFITNSTLTTVEADQRHRDHAVVEQVIAELNNGPLAHLPSGRYAANAAWSLLRHRVQPRPRRSCRRRNAHRTISDPAHPDHQHPRPDRRHRPTPRPAPPDPLALASAWWSLWHTATGPPRVPRPTTPAAIGHDPRTTETPAPGRRSRTLTEPIAVRKPEIAIRESPSVDQAEPPRPRRIHGPRRRSRRQRRDGKLLRPAPEERPGPPFLAHPRRPPIAIVTWIERTYHRRRRQAALGRLTPIEYETIMTTPAAQAA